MLGEFIETLVDLKFKRQQIENAKMSQVAVRLGGPGPVSYEVMNQELYDRHNNHLNRIDIEIRRLIEKINKMSLTKT